MTGAAARHGTVAGWLLHGWRCETPCPQCERARSEYMRRRSDATPAQWADRRNARAQARAEAAMRKLYPQDWVRLYAAAKVEIDALDAEFWEFW